MDSLEVKKWAYEQSLSKLREQISRSESVDNKTRYFLVFSGILLILIGLLIWRGTVVFGIPSLLVVAFAFIILIFDLRVRDWKNAPPINFLKWHIDAETDSENILDESIDAIKQSYQSSMIIEDKRSSRVNSAAIMLVLSEVLVFIGFVL